MPRKKDTTPSEDERPGLALMRRAEHGDEEAAKQVREGLKPVSLARLGDLVSNTEQSLIDRMAGKTNLLLRDSIRAQLDVLKSNVGGPSPSPLERLLVDRLALTWLELQYFETIYTQNMADMTLSQANHHQRRIDAAHARYLSAIKTLAQVRRLALPVVQVNVAQAGAQQLNVAAPAPVPALPEASDPVENGP